MKNQPIQIANTAAFLRRKPGETEDAMLLRLGNAKLGKFLSVTWDKIGMTMNAYFEKAWSDDDWRRRYGVLSSTAKEIDLTEYTPEPEEGMFCTSLIDAFDVPADNCHYYEYVDAKQDRRQKDRVINNDERAAANREIRGLARRENLIEMLRSAVSAYSVLPPEYEPLDLDNEEKAIYALIGDVHYGLEFSNAMGRYSPEICRERMARYCRTIIAAAEVQEIKVCYVSLLGDMISGMIHTTIRAENRVDVVQQIIGVSEIVAAFLYNLSQNFEEVFVNSVNGNHSRIMMNADDALNAERLDVLVPYIAKLRLANVPNVHFVEDENDMDGTVATFDIFDKKYVSVHGDMDKKPENSKSKIEDILGEDIDVFISAHLHVATSRVENCTYICNGSVCGSGDEYTTKKRLNGPPVQTFLEVSRNGVDAIRNVNLLNNEGV